MLIQVIKTHDNLKSFWKDIHLIMDTYKTEEVECYQILNYNSQNSSKPKLPYVFSGLYVFNSDEEFDKNIFKHISKINCKRETRTFYTLNVLTQLKVESNSETVDWSNYRNQLIVVHEQQIQHYKIRYLGKVDRFVASAINTLTSSHYLEKE